MIQIETQAQVLNNKQKLPFWKRRSSRFILIGLFFLMIMFLLYPYLFIHFSTHVPYAYQNDLKNILAIINYSINAPYNMVYHLPFLYPDSFVLAKTHPLFGVSLYFKIFKWCGLGLGQSYNMYIILALFLGAWGCYLLAREFTARIWLAAGLAAFYLIYHKNFLHFVWLNFLSGFYIPFIFFFFLRFIKSKKRSYGCLAVFFMFLQFFACIYPGVLVWLFLIPAFIFWSLWMGLLRYREFKFIIALLALTAVFMVVIYIPFTFVGQANIERGMSHPGVTPTDLFFLSKLLKPILNYPIHYQHMIFFPGFAVCLLLLLYVSSLYPLQKKRLTAVLFVFVILFVVLAYYESIFLDILFLVFVIGLITLIVIRWVKIEKIERLMFLVAAFHGMLFLNFPKIPILRSITLNEIFFNILPLQGLKEFRRLFPLGLPLAILLMVIAVERTLNQIGPKLNKKILATVVAGLMALFIYENILNIPKVLPIFKNYMMKKLWPEGKATVYNYLPYKGEKVVLEMPYYLETNQYDYNSDYMLNWEFHRNYLLNGKTAIIPYSYYFDLKSIIGTDPLKFPTESQIEQLIHKYSVNYIIFHLDRYQLIPYGPDSRATLKTMIKQIKDFGKITYRDQKTILLRTQEYLPVTKLVRTFSRYHLRTKYVVFHFQHRYDGEAQIYLNNRYIRQKTVHGDILKLNLKSESLSIYQNTLEVVLDHPMILNDYWLETIYTSTEEE